MIKRTFILIYILLFFFTFSIETNPSISLSQTQAYINNIHFSITFSETTFNNKELYVYLKCPSKQITFSSVIINEQVAIVSKLLTEGEVNSYMNSTTLQIKCQIEISFEELNIMTYDNITITLVKQVKKSDVKFSYISQEKKIIFRKVKIEKSNPIDDTNSYYYQIVYDNNDKMEYTEIIEIPSTIIDINKDKTYAYIIIFNNDKEIVYITDQCEIIDEMDITYEHLRNYYIQSATGQNIKVQLSGIKSAIISSISEVYFESVSGDTKNKLSLTEVLPAISETSKEFSTNMLLLEGFIGDYNLHINILGYDAELANQNVHIVKQIKDIFDPTSIQIENCDYYKSSYQFTPILANEVNPDLSMDYVQGSAVHHFKKVKKTFTLSSSDLNDIGTGHSEIRVYEHNEVDIPLYTISFTATNIVLDASSKQTTLNTNIIFSGLSCDATSILLSVQKTSSTSDIELTCENYINSQMTCFANPALTKGEYTIKVKHEIEIDKVNIYSEGDSNQIIITIPTDIKLGENTINISHTKNIEEIKQIKIKKNDALLYEEYNRPSATIDNKLLYFKYSTDNSIELVINLEADVKYAIKQIILDSNEIINYSDNDYVIVHYFSITSKYFFEDESPIKTVTLQFSSLSERELNLNNIFYKLDNDIVTASSGCTASKTDYSLLCTFHTKTGSKFANFGTSNALLSNQTIYFLTAKVSGTDKCYSYITNKYEPISIEISSPKDINIISKIDEVGTSITPLSTTSPYIFNINLQNLIVGSHTVYISVDNGSNIEVPNSTFTIRQLVKITGISPNTLYFTMDDQIITMEFTPNVITQGQIKNIIISDINDPQKAISSPPNSIDGYYNFLSFPVTTIDTPLTPGTYKVSYTSECDQVVETDFTIELKYNEIDSVNPLSTYLPSLLENDVTFTVTLKHSPSLGITLITLKNNERTKEYKPTSNGQSITFVIPKGDNDFDESLYTLSLEYNNDKSNVIYYSKKLVFYQNKIELARAMQIMQLNKTVTKLSIPLKNSIIKEQIYKIELVNVQKKVIEMSAYSLSNNNKQIDIAETITFSDVGNYLINIYDKSDEETYYTYTISSGDNFDLINAKLNITIDLPAITGDNFIYIKSGSYEVLQIKKIKFHKVNRINLSSEDIVFCTSDNKDTSCTNGYQIDYSNINGENSIKLNIRYETDDKYTIKYILNEISDGSDTLTYEDNEYVLEDYRIDNELIYVPKAGIKQIENININLYGLSAATGINQSISCSIKSDPVISCNPQCTVVPIESTSSNGNPITYYSLQCTFVLGTTIKERPYDVNIKFTLLDPTEKKLHLFVVNYDQDNICQLKGLSENVTLSVLYQNGLNDINFYLDSDTIILTEIKTTQITEGSYVYYNSNVIIPANVIESISPQPISLYLMISNTNNNRKVDDIPITIVDYSMRSYNGNLTAQVKTVQYIEYLFTYEINLEDIVSIVLNNTDNTISIKPSSCVASLNDAQGIKCQYDLSNHFDTGVYSIIYQTSACDRLFISGLTITVNAPPRTLRDVSPIYMMKNSSQTFYLTYLYKLYDSDIPSKVKLMVDKYTPEDGINEYDVTKEEDNIMRFEVDTNIQNGYYFLKLIYDSTDDSKNEYHYDITILVYENEMSFLSNPITKWTGENINEITNEFSKPIIIEQVKSISYRKNDGREISMNKDIDYSLSTTKLKILKDVEFTEICNYTITVTDVSGITSSFMIIVVTNVGLDDAKLIITFPRPASENIANEITIVSDNYNLLQITRIVMKKSDGNYFTIYNRDCIVNELNNTLIFNVTLPQWTYITLESISDATKTKNNFDGQYVTLRGYYPLRDFYFYEQSVIDLSFEFYEKSIASEAYTQMYFDEETEPSQDCTYSGSIVKCSYTIPESSNKEPKDIIVTVNGKAKKIIQLLTYTPDNICQINQLPLSNVILTINAESCQGEFNAILNGQNITSLCDESSHTYTYIFNAPSTTASNIYLERINRPLDVFDVQIPNVIVSLIKELEITEVFNSSQPFTTLQELSIDIKFNEDYLDITDIKYLILTKFSDNITRYDVTKCDLAYTSSTGLRYSCLYQFTSNEQAAKYYITFVNKCGVESERNNDTVITFFNTPNVIISVTPKAMRITNSSLRRNLRSLQSTNVFTLYFFNDLDQLSRPYSIDLVGSKKDSVYKNKVIIDDSSISGNMLQFKIDTSDITGGLYYLKVIFANGVNYLSEHYVILYYNELTLVETAIKQDLGASLPSLHLKCTGTIIQDQIQKITIKKQNDTSDEKEVQFGIVADSNEDTIFITFTPSLIIDNNYTLTIYDKGNDSNIQYYYIYYVGNTEYQIEKDIFFINNENGTIDININFASQEIADSNINNFAIIDSTNQRTLLQCKEGISFMITCQYSYSSFYMGTTVTLQLGTTTVSLLMKSIYLVKYTSTNLLLTADNYNLNFLNVISTLPLSFYLDNKALVSSISTDDEIYTYVITYYMLSKVIKDEGNYALYAKPNSRDKVSLNDIHYIFITQKEILDKSELYSQYIGIQKFIVQFNHSLIDNEIKSFTIQNGGNTYTTIDDTCVRKSNTNDTVICDINLQQANDGDYQLSYTNLLSETTNSNEMVSLKQTYALVTISPDLAELSSNTTITLSFNRNIRTLNKALYYVNKDLEEVQIEGIISTYNTVSFSLSNSLTEGHYWIHTILSSSYNIIANFTNKDLYLTLYNKDSGVFEFNRVYIISDNEPFTITIKPSVETIKNIYLENSETPLQKIEDYYVYTIPANSNSMTLSFCYTSTTAGDIKIDIQQKVEVVKEYTELFTVSTTFDTCTFYGDYLTVTLAPVKTTTLDKSRLHLILYKIRNGLMEKEYSFSTPVSGYTYTLVKNDYDELLSGSYILYIYDNNDLDKYLYKQEEISFTAMIPPSYILSTDTSITLSNVVCELDLTNTVLTVLQDDTIKSISIISSTYDSQRRQLTCNFNKGIIDTLDEYTFYQLFSHSNMLLGTLFISKPLSDATFSINTVGNIVRLTGNYYIPLVKSLIVNEGTTNVNSITFISASSSTSPYDNTFTVNSTSNVISFELPLYAHSYYLHAITSINNEERTRLNISISTSSSTELFTLPENMFFIDITETNPTVLVTVKLADSTFSSDNIYIDNSQRSLVESKPEENLYTFSYEATTPRTVYVTFQGTGYIDKKPIYISSYSYIGKTCQIRNDITNTDFIVSIVSPYTVDNFDKLILGNAIAENPTKSTVSYKTTREFTFKKEDLNTIGTFMLYAVINDKEVQVDNVSLSIFNSIKINTITGNLVQHYIEQNLTLSLSEGIANNDLPSVFHLRNINNPSMSVTTKECSFETTENQIINCSFDLTNIDAGTYTLLYKTKCDTLIEFIDHTIPISEQETNTIVSVPGTIFMSYSLSGLRRLVESSFTIEYSKNFNEGEKYKPVNISLLDINNENNEVIIEPTYITNNALNISLKDVPEGVYKIRSIYLINNKYYMNEDNKIVVVSNYPAILKTTSTIIVQNTKIIWLPIELTNPTFNGRFSKVTYTNSEKAKNPIMLKYTVDSANKNIVRVNTESIDFSSMKDYVFTLEDPGDLDNPLVYTVHIVSGVEIKANHYLFINTTPRPVIEISVSQSGIKTLFLIDKNNQIVNLTKNDNNVYTYTVPTNGIQTYRIAYSNNYDETTEYSRTIYVVDSLSNILDFSIDSCIYSKKRATLTVKNKDNFNLDIFTLTITLNRNTATVTSTYDPDTSTFTFSSDGLINEYTLTIYNNDNPSVDVPILYTQKITFTNISLTTTPFFSYIESNNEGTFQLSTSCDLGKNHIFFNGIEKALTCSYSSNRETCTYSSDIIDVYGLKSLLYDNISLEFGPYVYKSLKIAEFDINIPLTALGDNLITIQTKDYNIDEIAKITLVDKNNKNYTYCDSGCNEKFTVSNSILSFTVSLSSQSSNYYIKSLEDSSTARTFDSTTYVIQVDKSYAISIEPFIYYSKNETITLTTTFYNQTVYENITFYSIKTTSGPLIVFTYGEENKACGRQNCTLTALNDTSDITFSNSPVFIAFSFYDEKGNLKTIETNQNVRFAKAENLPSKIQGYNVIYSSNETTISLTYNKDIYDEYMNNIDISVNVSSKDDCSFNRDETNLNILNIICKGQLISDLSLNTTFFNEVSLSQNITRNCSYPKVPLIQNSMLKCVTCAVKSSSQPIYDNGTCLAACPSGKFLYESICYTTCNDLTNYSENGRCVDSCTEGFGLIPKSNECTNCTSRNEYLYNGNCIEECPTGYMANTTNNQCILIKTSSCQADYCKNGGVCDIQSGEPKCTCMSDFYGIICSHPGQTDAILVKEIDMLFDIIKPDNSATPPDLANETVVFSLRDLNVIFDQRSDIIPLMSDNPKALTFISSSQALINDTNTKGTVEEKTTGLLNLLGIIIDIATQGNLSQSGRLLDEVNANELKAAIESGLNYYRNLAYANRSIENFNRIDSVPRENLYLFTYKNNDNGLTSFKTKALESNIPYFDYSNCIKSINSPILFFVGIMIPSQLNNFLNNTSGLTDSASIQAIGSNNGLVELNECKNIKVYSNISYVINTDLYTYYKLKGIDFYDYNDPAFTERCWTSSNFDFDLTAKYRKNIVYQNMTFKQTEHKCNYSSIDNYTSTIEFVCPTGQFSYLFEPKELENKEMYNSNKLTLKCIGHLNVKKNFTFYVSLFVIILLLVGEIILLIFYENKYFPYVHEKIRTEKRSNVDNKPVLTEENPLHTESAPQAKEVNTIKKAFRGDTVKRQHEIKRLGISRMIKSNEKPTEIPGLANLRNSIRIEQEKQPELDTKTNSDPTRSSDVLTPSTISINVESMTFWYLFVKNLQELNPFAFIYKNMLKPTLMYSIALFITNLFVLFGFNAVYYTDSKLEGRIYDSFRDNFAYPMKTEFDKIVFSILTTFLITIILKGIIIVLYQDKDTFGIKEFMNIINIMRYSIGSVIMLFLLIFFAIYNTVFCGLFVKAKYSWLYSGIWSLFINWIILYPVGIAIVTIIEKFTRWGYKEQILYYVKYFLF